MLEELWDQACLGQQILLLPVCDTDRNLKAEKGCQKQGWEPITVN